ncbi:MAG: hypothetical protein AAGK05_16570, partial [Pseudomonadota bacterium]
MLISYLTDSLNKIIDNFPQSPIIVGGDFNHLDLHDIETQFCLTILDTPPTRGPARLDLLLTNRPNHIQSTSTFEPKLNSDHLAVVLTPQNRIPPVRKKVAFQDFSFKGFQYLNNSLSTHDFSNLLSTADVHEAAELLETTLSELINEAFPVKNVTMSDRDPSWLSPKAKWLLLKKKKANNPDKIVQLDKKLKQYKIASLKNNAKQTWIEIDRVSNRKAINKFTCNANIDAEQLNKDLADRSAFNNDHPQVEPNQTIHNTSSQPPQLSLTDVVDIMRKCKRTAPGPSNIPFFLFKQFWDILAPIYLYVWNSSLKHGTFPKCYKRANLTPIPKTNNPKLSNDFRGISVTPISARLFEKVVHRKWILPNIVHLGDQLQFAYRPIMSTVDCLLTLQH